MSEWLGANVVVLRELARQLEIQAARLTAVQTSVNRLVRSTEWQGSDATDFRAQWDSQYQPRCRALDQALRDGASKLTANADEQEQASGGRTVTPDPTPHDKGRSGAYEPADNVTLNDEDLRDDKIYQGAIGDCWLVASLGGVVAANPDFIRQHMRKNEDGTWTVTMYRDGEPVEITVEPTVIANGSSGPNDQPNWVSIYEKAAAIYFGGNYSDIDGDDPQRALAAITGGQAQTTGELDLNQIKQQLEKGPVVVSSEDKEPTWWPFDKDDDEHVADSRIVPNHAYMVEEIKEVDGRMMIHLRNPWGPSGGGDKVGDIWLTEQQYKESFAFVSSVAMPKGE